jgi:hypothetical protein
MSKLILQVQDSLNFMRRFLPDDVETADQLFNFLKARLVFVNDPPNTELLQTSQTLFKNNPHGISGAGDCDCFCITALAALYLLHIPSKIVLAGRSLNMPVHIYLFVFDAGSWKPFDLTEPAFNCSREYPHKFEYFVPFVYKNNDAQNIENKDDFIFQQKKVRKNLLS